MYLASVAGSTVFRRSSYFPAFCRPSLIYWRPRPRGSAKPPPTGGLAATRFAIRMVCLQCFGACCKLFQTENQVSSCRWCDKCSWEFLRGFVPVQEEAALATSQPLERSASLPDTARWCQPALTGLLQIRKPAIYVYHTSLCFVVSFYAALASAFRPKLVKQRLIKLQHLIVSMQYPALSDAGFAQPSLLSTRSGISRLARPRHPGVLSSLCDSVISWSVGAYPVSRNIWYYSIAWRFYPSSPCGDRPRLKGYYSTNSRRIATP